MSHTDHKEYDRHNQTWRHKLLRKQDRAVRRAAMQRNDWDMASANTFRSVSALKNVYIINW